MMTLLTTILDSQDILFVIRKSVFYLKFLNRRVWIIVGARELFQLPRYQRLSLLFREDHILAVENKIRRRSASQRTDTTLEENLDLWLGFMIWTETKSVSSLSSIPHHDFRAMVLHLHFVVKAMISLEAMYGWKYQKGTWIRYIFITLMGINNLFSIYLLPQYIVSLPARSALHLRSCNCFC